MYKLIVEQTYKGRARGITPNDTLSGQDIIQPFRVSEIGTSEDGGKRFVVALDIDLKTYLNRVERAFRQNAIRGIESVVGGRNELAIKESLDS